MSMIALRSGQSVSDRTASLLDTPVADMHAFGPDADRLDIET